MKVRFWGTRGSIPVPGKDTINYGGNTTCVEITLESGRRVIIDSGTGIRALGDHLSSEENAVNIHLLITHIHWDHVAGFPFFAPIHDPATKISVDGFPTCMKGLKIPFDNKMSNGLFPVKFDDLKAEINYLDKLKSGPLEVDGVVIDSIPLRHPQGGFGFRFRDGKKTFVFLTDNELTKEMLGGSHAVDYVSFCKDADLLVHDAQYTPEEIDERRGWGHSDYVTALNLASEAHAKRLILFHHDPSRKDPEIASIVAQCQELAGRNNDGIVIDAAKEGAELTC
ncbi:MAG: MBL fold metallo-hydrolase [Deltaproteobacteria bacterium]|nr:MBL fold metallo-hydrolase [Deltaproteobacteria bacterium]